MFKKLVMKQSAIINRSFTTDEIDAVVACLGDDAAMLRDAEEYPELAYNMEQALALIAYLQVELKLQDDANNILTRRLEDMAYEVRTRDA